MSDRDLGERMERLARRADGAAAPDLYAVRQRHARRRTRGALAVGLSVMLVGSLLAYGAFRSGPPEPVPGEPDWTLPANPMVWPLPGTYEEAPWRDDPEQVVRRFAQTVLGWSDPGVQNIDAIVEPTRPGSYFEVFPEPCPATARCPSLLVIADEGEGGRWGVATVWQGDDLTPRLDGVLPTLSAGTVTFDLILSDDRSAHVGLVASNGCRDVSSIEIGLDAGSFELPVPEPVVDDPGCSDIGAGYVFAYATDDTTVPVGDPLLEAAAIEYPWLTVVPIYLQMEAPQGTADPAPGVLDVTCGSEGTTVAAPSVVARPDGVHLDIESAGAPVSLAIDEDQRIFFDGVPGELILLLEPGQHAVECISSNDDQVVAVGEATFDVLDPGRYWVDPSLACSKPASAVLNSGDLGTEGDPTDEMVAWAAGWRTPGEPPLPEGGSFQAVGYPEGRETRMLGYRSEGGDLIARFEFYRAGNDWRPDGVLTCEHAIIF